MAASQVDLWALQARHLVRVHPYDATYCDGDEVAITNLPETGTASGLRSLRYDLANNNERTAKCAMLLQY